MTTDDIKQYNFSGLYHMADIKPRLMQLLTRFIRPLRHDILALFIGKLSDATVVKCLTYYADSLNTGPNNSSYQNVTSVNNKAIRRATRYKEAIDNIPSQRQTTVRKYLDIGSNNGMYTVALGQLYGLSKDAICGIDMGKFAGINIKPIDGFNYKDYDGVNIPYGDNEFDLVTLFMVLHHVRKPKELLREINRVIKTGGVLLLREHDTENNESYNSLFTLEHYLYMIFYEKEPFDKFYKEYYDNYYSKKELIELMESEGFEYVRFKESYQKKEDDDYKHHNPTNYYHIAFVKL